MAQPEFLEWVEFFKLYPFDDHHRYHRPAALGFASAFLPEARTQAIEDALRWLSPPNDEYSDADLATMRAMGFKKKAG
jgi:hypothetical protein